MRKLRRGNEAAAEAVKLSRVQVIAAYPITPQTSIAESLSDFVSKKKLDARYMRVESETSALACLIGASMAGARSFTATSSQGLALMHELLHWASGARLPIVLMNVNRSMAAPWSLGTDHIDSLSQRDTGWLQFYCEKAPVSAQPKRPSYVWRWCQRACLRQAEEGYAGIHGKGQGCLSKPLGRV